MGYRQRDLKPSPLWMWEDILTMAAFYRLGMHEEKNKNKKRRRLKWRYPYVVSTWRMQQPGSAFTW